MSVTDYNDLKNRSEEIKNETVKKANTSERVGSLLEDINDTYNSELDNVDTLLDGKQDANSALDNVSGINTGDETTNTIQAKRPLKTINGESLEGTGDITTPVTTDASDLTSGTLPDARLSSAVQSSLSLADSALQSVDKNDVGLSNVDNTSDADKPVSTATQAEIDTKQDTLVSGTNIKTINNESILGSGNITISGGGSTFSIFDLTSDYTLTLADRGKTFINQTANDYEITIPANSSVDFAEDFAIACIPTSTGKIKVKGDAGVTIQPVQTTTIDRPMSILRFGIDNYISVGVKENYTPEPVFGQYSTEDASSEKDINSLGNWSNNYHLAVETVDTDGSNYALKIDNRNGSGFTLSSITITAPTSTEVTITGRFKVSSNYNVSKAIIIGGLTTSISNIPDATTSWQDFTVIGTVDDSDFDLTIYGASGSGLDDTYYAIFDNIKID